MGSQEELDLCYNQALVDPEVPLLVTHQLFTQLRTLVYLPAHVLGSQQFFTRNGRKHNSPGLQV